MNYLFTGALLVTIPLCSCSVVKTPDNDKTFELLILHNNDMHARFEQTSQLSGICTTADREAGKCYGGFARVAHVVKQARAEAASGQGPPVLYLNAGDTYTGTAWFTIYKWKIAAEFINALNPDAVALGNNELEKESKNTSPFLNNIKTNILASNVALKSEEIDVQFKKSVILNLNGIQVGLIGYLTPEANVLENFDIEYINEVIAVQEEATKLKASGVNIIIAIGHSGNEKVTEIAKEVSEIDLIINGNKNVYYWNGTTIADDLLNSGLSTVTQKTGKKVPIVKSFAYDKYLGQITIQFNSIGDVIKCNATPILLDTSIPQDSEVTRILNKFETEILGRNDDVVGNTSVVLDGDSCKTEECNLGNMIADAIMYRYARLFNGSYWTDAPIAIIQGGAIAASIAPSNRPASVTKNDIRTSLPFESHLAVLRMNSSILLQVLERSVYEYRKNNNEFLQISGIRVVYDLKNEPGERVISVVARCSSCFVPDYFALDHNREYTVIMPAALANGENGYSMLVGLPRTDLDYDEITCTEEYITIHSPVYPEIADRITLLNSSVTLFASFVSVLLISILSILLH